MMMTAVPLRTTVPAAGFVPFTLPRGDPWVPLTVRPAPCSAEAASVTDMPTTGGIATVGGPLDTVIGTAVPRGTVSPPDGDSMTLPASTVSLDCGVTVTPRPMALSSAVASAWVLPTRSFGTTRGFGPSDTTSGMAVVLG